VPTEETPDPEPAKTAVFSDATKTSSKAKTRTGLKRQRKVYPTITKNRLFAALIGLVSGFALLGFLGLVLLAFFGKEPPTQPQSRLADVCYFVITASIGALVGLLGGRAAAPDTWQSGEPKK
jgi:hypothetical protein